MYIYTVQYGLYSKAYSTALLYTKRTKVYSVRALYESVDLGGLRRTSKEYFTRPALAPLALRAGVGLIRLGRARRPDGAPPRLQPTCTVRAAP